MDFKVVFIDDNLDVNEPIVQNIRKHYKNADYSHVFKNPQEGLGFVLENINSRMIVFLDWNFSGLPTKGIDILKEIRKKTSLLYVIMMSANPVTSFPAQSVIDMMNEENFFFLDRSQDIDVTFGLIDKIQKNWVTRFDCILEQWLINHPECSDKIAFRTFDQTITWQKILEELRKQSTIGKSFEKMVNQFYIYQFTENSEANE